MKHIISAVVAVVCVLIGGITGHFVKNGLSAAASTGSHEQPAKAESHGEPGGHGGEEKDSHKEKKDAGKAKKHSSGHGGGGESDVAYFKFTREFIVPIMHDRKVESLLS
jgi:flagellar FliL protein